MDSLTFLDRATPTKLQPIYVLFGDEDFLKRQALARLKTMILGEGDDAFGLSVYSGDKADFSVVRTDLDTLPFLSPRRMVLVEAADPFVSKHRATLEKYVDQPATNGVLVLDVKSWPANTRLAKLLKDEATIICKTPPTARLQQWCVARAKVEYGKQLAQPAAQLLVDLIGPEMGQLDQELAKLAIYVGVAARIEAGDVDLLVGRSRAADTFKIFDAIGAGRAGDALAILDRLFDQGDEPLQILGAFSWQLRRLAQVARISQQGVSVHAAMDRVGVPPFARSGVEQQVRHLGRRTARLYDWLLEADLGMKGASPLPPRLLLERLVMQLAQRTKAV